MSDRLPHCWDCEKPILNDQGSCGSCNDRDLAEITALHGELEAARSVLRRIRDRDWSSQRDYSQELAISVLPPVLVQKKGSPR